MKRVLVLCVGNSCRSQMAEGYLKFYGDGKAEYFSAGLRQNDVHPLAIKVMAEDSIDISWHISEIMEVYAGQHFDYVISVCDEISDQIPTFITADKFFHLSVPDPAQFVGSPAATLNEFRRVREMLKTYMLKFLGSELTEKEEVVLS